jgi:hypothetical protein
MVEEMRGLYVKRREIGGSYVNSIATTEGGQRL